MRNKIIVPAILINQNSGTPLYSFAIDGKLLSKLCAVSRIKRNENEIEGYQRPEILNHISEIKRYLESSQPLLPNAVVVSFDKRVIFNSIDKKCNLENVYQDGQLGELHIPFDENWSENERPGFIVDGQQRIAAMRDIDLKKFPIFATAFITESVELQTEQFILVNSTKPLSKSLIYELLPYTNGDLPSHLKKRQFSASLLEILNTSPDSPLYKMIRTPTIHEGVIKDTAILKTIENSLSDGALYVLRSTYGKNNDYTLMVELMKQFWSAVKTVFHESWGLPPRKSRLMHGAGIVALGFMMDAIVDRLRGNVDEKDFEKDLYCIKPICKWTAGYWEFGPGQQRRWNEIQNTSKDVKLLANYLLLEYKRVVWDTNSDLVFK